MERRLAAILAADVVGYSRLMGEDETGTLERLKSLRNPVRITTQVVKAASGNHLWAERYDRDLEDIFALQDEMTQTIVGAVKPELSAAERERAARKPPSGRYPASRPAADPSGQACRRR